jgi:hypothetical protein
MYVEPSNYSFYVGKRPQIAHRQLQQYQITLWIIRITNKATFAWRQRDHLSAKEKVKGPMPVPKHATTVLNLVVVLVVVPSAL